MKLLAVIILIGAVTLVGYHAFQFMETKVAVEKKYADIENKLKVLEAEKKKMEDNIRYYSNTANLLKELRSQLNYHWPDEKMIIVVP